MQYKYFNTIRYTLLVLYACTYYTTNAQVQPSIAPVEFSIFLSPSGDDNNTGSISSPLRSFDAALNKLPYGTNGQTRYSEVVFLSGHYVFHTEIRQPCWQFFNDEGYKAVSIRGIHRDSVILDGSAAATTSGNFIELLGSHISVKDLTVQLASPSDTAAFWGAIDFKSGVAPCYSVKTTNILVENVTINGCYDHGIHIDRIDTALVKNCTLTHTNLVNINGKNEGIPNAGWGSAIKARLSNHIEIHDCNIHEVWGEGMSIARCTDVLVHHNYISDTYSVNLYIDNASNGIVRNNLCYATLFDSTYWRNQIPAAGIGVAAEYYPDNDFALDSNILIYNNIVLNEPGLTLDVNRYNDDPAGAELKKIWFCNNSIVGWQGNINKNIRAIRINFEGVNSGHFEMDSIFIYNNLIALSEDFIAPDGLCQFVSGSTEVLPTSFFYARNYWSHDPRRYSFLHYPYNAIEDTINENIPLSTVADSLGVIRPNASNQLLYTGIPLDFIQDDYFGVSRNGNYNIGAIAPNNQTMSSSIENNASLRVIPNPCTNLITITSKNQYAIGQITCFSLSTGQVVLQQNCNTKETILDMTVLRSGTYVLFTQGTVAKIVKL